jgi:enoyl-CoA hydratase
MPSLEIHDAGDRVFARLARPDTRNAIDEGMCRELNELCADLESTPRVLILSGSPTVTGAVFASGTDISELRGLTGIDALAGSGASLFDRIAALPMPVIAAVDGFALGSGAELAYAADFRIGTSRTTFGNPETGLGIMAAAGATWRLERLVGQAVATDMLLAGRILDSVQALRLNLLTEVHEPENLLHGAADLADRILRQDPLATRLTKLSLRAPREAHPMVDNLAQAVLFESEQKYERMTRFLDRHT